MTTTVFHAGVSVDIDRFSDAHIADLYLPILREAHGLPDMTVADVRRTCIAARARGMEVFPPCDKTGPNGACLGHEGPREDDSGVHSIHRGSW